MIFKAFLINLKNNPERLAFMEKQLGEANIPFSREDAVYGKTYDFSQVYNKKYYQSINKGREISLGELGCALSHKHALERMLHEECDYALIMEDDVALPKHFKKILDQELSSHQEGKASWEYLSFNYPSVGYKAIILWLFLFFTMFNNKKGLVKYLTLPIYFLKFLAVSSITLLEALREFFYRRKYKYGKPAQFLRPLYLAGCYLVTKEGAKKLLKLQTPSLAYTADQLPNVARLKENLKFFGFVPLQVVQRRDMFQSNSVAPEFDEKVKKFMGGRLLRE